VDVKGELRFIGIVEETGEQEAKLRIFPEFSDGLRGIEDFSHILILYWIHQRDNEMDRRTLLVQPRRHAVNMEKGVFACRSPSRPNSIGMCVVELTAINGCVLTARAQWDKMRILACSKFDIGKNIVIVVRALAQPSRTNHAGPECRFPDRI